MNLRVAGTPSGKRWHFAEKPVVGFGPVTTLCGVEGAYISNLTPDQMSPADEGACVKCQKKQEEK